MERSVRVAVNGALTVLELTGIKVCEHLEKICSRQFSRQTDTGGRTKDASPDMCD